VQNIAEKFYPLSRAHECYRQTTDRRRTACESNVVTFA